MHPSELDPISLRAIDDIDNAPFLMERVGTHELKLHFENEINRLAYIKLSVDGRNAAADEHVQRESVTRRTGTYS